MNQPQRTPKDEPERQVLSNIQEFGWHCVNVIEDDGHPPCSILRLAELFGRPALARHRRVRRASPTAALRLLPSLRSCRYIRVSAFDRFGENLYLVEKASDLTLPDFVRWSIHGPRNVCD
jgi:hypothetical protein